MKLIIVLLCALIAVSRACEDTPECESKLSALKTEKNDPEAGWICSLWELEEACQNTCGYCGECKDARSDCDYYKTEGKCTDDHTAHYCRKTCEKC